MSGLRTALVRSLLLPCALAGVLWSAVALPPFWRAVPVHDAAVPIIADDRFKPGALANVLAGLEDKPAAVLSQPQLTQAKALIRVRIAEEAIGRKSSAEADRSVASAFERVMTALMAMPGNSFLWLMLYSVETARNGFDPRYIRYLDRSYATGPREGWISLKRNRLALAVFPMLSEIARGSVISEFTEMVDADLIEDAAANLTGVGWQSREQLLTALISADITSRQRLYRRLATDGIKVIIPGLPIDERQWR